MWSKREFVLYVLYFGPLILQVVLVKIFFVSPIENNVLLLQDNAYPADELMPLSCQGRYRGVQPSRGDIDDTLGK